MQLPDENQALLTGGTPTGGCPTVVLAHTVKKNPNQTLQPTPDKTIRGKKSHQTFTTITHCLKQKPKPNRKQQHSKQLFFAS